MVEAFADTGLVADHLRGNGSTQASTGRSSAKFILSTDPLDGSANVDANGAVGMIFAVYRRPEGVLGAGCLKSDRTVRLTTFEVRGIVIVA